jgi:hypothetical protein
MNKVHHIFFTCTEIFGAIKETKEALTPFYTDFVLDGTSTQLFKTYCKMLEARLEYACKEKKGMVFIEYLTNMQAQARELFLKQGYSAIYKSGMRPTNEDTKYFGCDSTEFTPLSLTKP